MDSPGPQKTLLSIALAENARLLEENARLAAGFNARRPERRGNYSSVRTTGVTHGGVGMPTAPTPGVDTVQIAGVMRRSSLYTCDMSSKDFGSDW